MIQRRMVLFRVVGDIVLKSSCNMHYDRGEQRLGMISLEFCSTFIQGLRYCQEKGSTIRSIPAVLEVRRFLGLEDGLSFL